MQVNRQKTTVKKWNLFFEKLCCFFIHIFWKSLCNLQIFTARCLDVRFWDLLYFICLKFNPQYWYLLLRREKMCWFSSYFYRVTGRDFCRIFTKSQKLCLHKILNIGSTGKVNSREFCVFVIDVKCIQLQYC